MANASYAVLNSKDVILAEMKNVLIACQTTISTCLLQILLVVYASSIYKVARFASTNSNVFFVSQGIT